MPSGAQRVERAASRSRPINACASLALAGLSLLLGLSLWIERLDFVLKANRNSGASLTAFKLKPPECFVSRVINWLRVLPKIVSQLLQIIRRYTTPMRGIDNDLWFWLFDAHWVADRLRILLETFVEKLVKSIAQKRTRNIDQMWAWSWSFLVVILYYVKVVWVFFCLYEFVWLEAEASSWVCVRYGAYTTLILVKVIIHWCCLLTS